MIKGIFLDLSWGCAVLSHFSCVRLFEAPWAVAAGMLVWAAMSPSRGSSWPRDWAPASYSLHWPPGKPSRDVKNDKKSSVPSDQRTAHRERRRSATHSLASQHPLRQWVGSYEKEAAGTEESVEWVWFHYKAGVTLEKIKCTQVVCSKHEIYMDTQKEDIGTNCWGRWKQRCTY